jgi:hypothetical protein
MAIRINSWALLPLGILLATPAFAQSSDSGATSPASSAPGSSAPQQVKHPSRKGASKVKGTDAAASSPVTPDTSSGRTGRGGHGGTEPGGGDVSGGSPADGTGTGGVPSNGAIIGGGGK